VPDDEDEDEGEEPDHVNRETGSDDRFADLEDDEGEGSDDPADMLDDLPEEDEPKKEKDEKETPWQANFRRKANGELDPVLNNIALICMNDRRIAPCIGFNEFTMDPVCLKPIRAPKIATPSPEVPRQERRHGRKWEDRDDTSISLIASANAERGGYESDFAELKIQQAVIAAGSNNPIHPVKDFIQTQYQRWLKEGSPRGELERLTIDYLGTPDTVFHRESAKMFMVAAVARIYEPGCKFDVMAIIEGPTGSGKSTFWRTLFGGFFSELKADLEDTGRLVEALRGNWALEMAEMRAAKRTDSNTLKMQLSSSEDQHRLAYARREMRFKRQSVFVGTSNENDYLSDPTSNRRYWVWRTKKDLWDKIDNPGLSERLWAIIGDAYQVYLDMRAKQPEGDLWLDLHSRTAILEQQQIAEGSRKRTVTEEVADVIADWLQERYPADEVLVDENRMPLDGHEGDGTPMVRNMVCATEAYEQLRDHPLLGAYQRLDPRTFGRALGHVKGWTSLGKCRRHGVLAPWYFRDQDGPRWVPAPEEDEDDILS
jgi:hypothetical protein